MKIAVLKERAIHESRVAATPETVRLFTKDGFTVYCEKGCGLNAGILDKDYIDAGAVVSSVLLEILADADIILKVQPTPPNEPLGEIGFAKKKSVIVGLLSPSTNQQLLKNYADKEITSISLELLPRITKAQSMDALSSQANIAGYRAVIEAAYNSCKVFPMLMTSAGVINPIKVLVLGAGVAGLQAIATAKRLGAVVSAYDIRSASKEQVESIGGKFITWDQSINIETKGGYAQNLEENNQAKQNDFLLEQVQKFDVVITTAQIPNRLAPILITNEMIKKMKPSSVIVDIATGTGGNVQASEKDKVTEVNHVKIIGYSNLAARSAEHSSKLYAKNLYNLIKYVINDKTTLNVDDEIIKPMILTHEGKILYGK